MLVEVKLSKKSGYGEKGSVLKVTERSAMQLFAGGFIDPYGQKEEKEVVETKEEKIEVETKEEKPKRARITKSPKF